MPRSQREKVEIGRLGLHWAEIDEDISIAGLLAGRRDLTVNGPRGIKTASPRARRTSHSSKRRKRA
jgi:Protein of unknown function (DUF2442)